MAENNLTQAGEPEDKTAEYNGRNIKLKRDEEVDKTIEGCDLSKKEKAEIRKNSVCYESPNGTVNISIDDFNVKRQKEERGGR